MPGDNKQTETFLSVFFWSMAGMRVGEPICINNYMTSYIIEYHVWTIKILASFNSP